MGLFVSPINTATGQGIAAISLAMAAGQLVWGVAQPIAGAFADRWGPGRVLAAGIVALALGMAVTPFMTSNAGRCSRSAGSPPPARAREASRC